MNFKNHLTLQYYKYSPTENKYLYYTDKVKNMSVFRGIILIKLESGVMKTQLIVKVQDTEKRLDKLYPQTRGNNVHELTTNMS